VCEEEACITRLDNIELLLAAKSINCMRVKQGPTSSATARAFWPGFSRETTLSVHVSETHWGCETLHLRTFAETEEIIEYTYARGLHHDKAQHTRQESLKRLICDLFAKKITQHASTSAHQAGECAQGKETLNIRLAEKGERSESGRGGKR